MHENNYKPRHIHPPPGVGYERDPVTRQSVAVKTTDPADRVFETGADLLRSEGVDLHPELAELLEEFIDARAMALTAVAIRSLAEDLKQMDGAAVGAALNHLAQGRNGPTLREAGESVGTSHVAVLKTVRRLKARLPRAA